MASKEIMVSAPLIVLLYDRAFLSGSFGEAWRRRRGLYVALAGTWVLLGWLVVTANNRGGSAGLGTGPNGTVECNLFRGMKKGRCACATAGVSCGQTAEEEMGGCLSGG
jgi:hypothetical protein